MPWPMIEKKRDNEMQEEEEEEEEKEITRTIKSRRCKMEMFIKSNKVWSK